MAPRLMYLDLASPTEAQTRQLRTHSPTEKILHRENYLTALSAQFYLFPRHFAQQPYCRAAFGHFVVANQSNFIRQSFFITLHLEQSFFITLHLEQSFFITLHLETKLFHHSSSQAKLFHHSSSRTKLFHHSSSRTIAIDPKSHIHIAVRD